MRAYKEFAIVAWGLCAGLGFVWLFSFAIGNSPVAGWVSFVLACGAGWLGWRLDRS